ncbi:CidA/LrgA family protein [Prevotella sp. A2931]|uniref:CidA/LrgA family protein n=1 Tax=Prevotella illustrans TaxID=2800387 RepID=A0ABS3M6P4_9BACT|nr:MULTISPECIES: CidA/LrgA family protein [Prevotella]MBO1363852.1 CidA/LrgA family protein [Prevotella illustrans]PTL26269.1 murein hydrolase regulator LrgA [Prevotella sp. oral taxon 820]
MKFVKQFLLILLFSFLGELLHVLIPLPFPASIYGIVLLFAALSAKVVKVKDVREVSVFLIAVMPVMFIPPAVGLIDSWDDIRSNLLRYVVVTVVSTFVVMAAAGKTTQYAIRRHFGKKRRECREGETD